MCNSSSFITGSLAWRVHRGKAYAGFCLVKPFTPHLMKWTEAVRDVRSVAVDENCAWWVLLVHKSPDAGTVLISLRTCVFFNSATLCPWLDFGLVVPLRGDWALFCHAGSGRVGRMWSARETSLKITRHGRELNPGHREDRQWDTFVLPLSYHDRTYTFMNFLI